MQDNAKLQKAKHGHGVPFKSFFVLFETCFVPFGDLRLRTFFVPLGKLETFFLFQNDSTPTTDLLLGPLSDFGILPNV